MAADLGLSPSQVHASLKRLERSRLIALSTNKPQLRAVEEFLLHGVKYAFPALRGKADPNRELVESVVSLLAPVLDELASSADARPESSSPIPRLAAIDRPKMSTSSWISPRTRSTPYFRIGFAHWDSPRTPLKELLSAAGDKAT